MARPTKEGLDYFELECQVDDKIKLIQAEFGLKGFAIVVKLFQRIYGYHGYYCEWDEDRLLLFMSENGLSGDSRNMVKEVVNACIRRGIFSEEKYEKYHVLTSHGIQKRYIAATAKREKVLIERAYLLYEVGEESISDVINVVSDGRNSISDGRNTQSREEKRRVEKRKEENGSSEEQPRTTVAVIESYNFNPELEQAVKEWVKYKTEKNQGYKETGLKKLLSGIRNKAAEIGESAVISALDEAMSNNWQGFHFDRVESKSSRIKNRLKEVDTWTL